MGKTNLDEFGMGSQSVHSAFGPVRSPYGGGDTSRSEATAYSAGGSSGGSAVAVAVGDADVALGTDTGGSVRLPAAYTGVVGFKPSYGMISRRGVVPYANSLDTVGLLARDVETIEELIVGGCAGVAEDDGGGNNANRAGVGDDEVWRDGLWNENDPLDPTSLTPATRLRCARVRMGYRCGESSCRDGNAEEWKNGIRYDAVTDRNDVRLDRVVFGLPLEYNVAELDPRIRDAWRRTAELLQRELGCSVVPVSLPWTRHALSAYYIIAPAEASSNLAKYDGVRYGLRESGAEGGHGAGEGTRGAGRVGDSGQLYAATRGRGLGAEVRRRILLGAYSLSASARHNYFVRAQRVRRLVRRDFDAAFRLGNPLVDSDEGESETRFKEDKAADAQQHYDLSDLHVAVPLHDKHGPVQVDFLLCPTAPTLPPRLRDIARQNPVESYTNDVFTVPASLAGLPAISIPVDLDIGAAGHGADAVNGAFNFAGMQLIGQFWDDARLLAVARTLAPLLRRETR